MIKRGALLGHQINEGILSYVCCSLCPSVSYTARQRYPCKRQWWGTIPGVSPAINTIKAKKVITRWRREARQEVSGGAGAETAAALQ